jgi:dihydroorotate dehydrogenase electron transfer subunit
MHIIEKAKEIRTTDASVKSIRTVGSEYVDVELACPFVAEHALPGQFVMVHTLNETLQNLLYRPFDIAQTDRSNGSFRLLVKITGKETLNLSHLKTEEEIRVTGPLGKGIVDFNSRSIGLLVRGVGSAAVISLAQKARQEGIKVYTFFSASTGGRLVGKEYLRAFSDELFIVTDDGSEGHHGDAREVVSSFLEKREIQSLYTCGSRRFARYVQELNREGNTEGYIFLEELMGCGIGYCHGCAVKKAKEEGYYLVCVDGPIFSADEVEIP